jgi:hypothetical protein
MGDSASMTLAKRWAVVAAVAVTLASAAGLAAWRAKRVHQQGLNRDRIVTGLTVAVAAKKRPTDIDAQLRSFGCSCRPFSMHRVTGKSLVAWFSGDDRSAFPGSSPPIIQNVAWLVRPPDDIVIKSACYVELRRDTRTISELVFRQPWLEEASVYFDNQGRAVGLMTCWVPPRGW